MKSEDTGRKPYIIVSYTVEGFGEQREYGGSRKPYIIVSYTVEGFGEQREYGGNVTTTPPPPQRLLELHYILSHILRIEDKSGLCSREPQS
jgi:hypothetical protein